MKRLWAILFKRCPNCLKGPVYAGYWTMYPTCPVCGFRFQRDAGHFLGAMYVNYPIGALVLGCFALLIHWLLPSWSFHVVMTVAVIPFLLTVPEIVRYSRILWLHFDQPFVGKSRPNDRERPT